MWFWLRCRSERSTNRRFLPLLNEHAFAGHRCRRSERVPVHQTRGGAQKDDAQGAVSGIDAHCIDTEYPLHGRHLQLFCSGFVADDHR